MPVGWDEGYLALRFSQKIPGDNVRGRDHEILANQESGAFLCLWSQNGGFDFTDAAPGVRPGRRIKRLAVFCTKDHERPNWSSANTTHVALRAGRDTR